MPKGAKIYVGAVVAGGAGMLVLAASSWQSSDPRAFLVYLALALGASLIKLRLPGMDGTYSLSFLFVLIGLSRFSLSETVVAGCLAALAQSMLATEKRPTPVQLAFNVGNLVISIGLCFYIGRTLLQSLMQSFPPAALAAAACVFFVMNTMLVSGILSLVQGKALYEVSREWYVWSFPYYLIGAALVGLLPLAPLPVDPYAWVILAPPLYLIHFFYGLSLIDPPSGGVVSREAEKESLSTPAKLYLGAVITSGLAVLIWSAYRWDVPDVGRFGAFLAVTLLFSCCKVRLPGMTGTISLSFVVLLAAIIELSLPEVVGLAASSAVIQSVWRPKVTPQPVQVWFSLASMALSSSLTFYVCHAALEAPAGAALVPYLVLATVVLYSSNVLQVAAALCFAERRPLRRMWEVCCFWTLPYYFTGTAFAGLMVAATRTVNWPASFLILPLLSLVYVSYRIHVRRAHSL